MLETLVVFWVSKVPRTLILVRNRFVFFEKAIAIRGKHLGDYLT